MSASWKSCAVLSILLPVGALPVPAAAWSMWFSDDSYEECIIKEIQKHGIKNDAMAREIIKKCRELPARQAPYESSSFFGSRTAGNCVLKNGKDVQGPLGTRLLTMACYRTYPRE